MLICPLTMPKCTSVLFDHTVPNNVFVLSFAKTTEIVKGVPMLEEINEHCAVYFDI